MLLEDINFDKFNQRSVNAIDEAYTLALSKHQNPVDVWHLLFSLLDQGDDTIDAILDVTGNTVDSIRAAIKTQIFDLLKLETWFLDRSDVHMSRALSSLFKSAQRSAEELNDAYVRPEHLLLAISQSKNTTGYMLNTKWISADKILQVMQKRRMQSPWESVPIDVEHYQRDIKSDETSLINSSENLTTLAKNHTLDQVFFRDEEVNNIIQILLRSYNNNVIVVWEPWSGNTSLVHALAQKVSSNEVPENLQGTQILSLDMGDLSMGNKHSWDLEKKLQTILLEAGHSTKPTLLFVDDFQNLVDLFKNQSMTDLWILLKSCLSKSNVKIIWTTDVASYGRIQTNPLLATLFQKVENRPTTLEDTTTILRYQKDKLEHLHSIGISEEAISYALQFSDRYISDREFPDKAIALLDEATARKKMNMLSLPDSLLKIKQKLLRLETEKTLLTAQNNPHNQSKLDDILKQTETLDKEYSAWLANREFNKTLFLNIQWLHKQVFDLEQTPSTANQEKIISLKKEISDQSKTFKDILTMPVSGLVSKEDVAWVVSLKTGIPMDKINKTESQKLLELESLLSSKVIGQDKAVTALSNAVRRSRSGLSDPKKPIWSFIFLWSTGVWKTELAKSLAEILFDDEKFLIRIDMSEYQEKHSVSKLIGSPPGYVGYDQWGQLTEAIKENPYSVILFDEIEKADPDVFKLLLQVLDDGRLTDGKWRTISFKNTIIIMTSNLWSDAIIQTFDEIKADQEKNPEENTAPKEDTSAQKLKELEDFLKESVKEKSSPEFLNRIDEFIMFNPISKEMITQILEIHLKKFEKIVSQEKNITLQISDQAKDFLATKWRDPAMGARPVKRAIQDYLANPLSKKLISWTFGEGDLVLVDIENGELSFKKN